MYIIRLGAAGVYPRMHGGTVQHGPSMPDPAGLSPHARGNRCGMTTGQNRNRSIPACTGEPVIFRATRQLSQVYPRMHGGTQLVTKLNALLYGLSPHARGNLPAATHRASAIGSIPACTGEPYPDAHDYRLAWVYPRMHGGTGQSRPARRRSQGLSPHARGNL